MKDQMSDHNFLQGGSQKCHQWWRGPLRRQKGAKPKQGADADGGCQMLYVQVAVATLTTAD